MKHYQRLLAALALIWSTSLYAADPKTERSKELFASAKEHYDKKEYAEALAEFEELLRVSDSSAVYLNIAQCHRLMGKYEEAVTSYRKFLEENPKTPYRAQIEEKVSEMESALQEARARAEAKAKEEAQSKPVVVESTYASTTQPAVEPTSTWSLPPDVTKRLEAQMRGLEDTTQDSMELALKRTSRLRYVLPGGLALMGGALGVSAIALHTSMEAAGQTTKGAQRTLMALALGADLSFVSAGATFYFAARKNSNEARYYVGITPALNSGALSIGFIR